MLTAHKNLKRLSESSRPKADHIEAARSVLKEKRIYHRKLVRSYKACESVKRDQKLFSFASGNPNIINKSLKQSKTNSCTKIQSLTVGSKVYTGESIPDGFYDSLLTLKTQSIPSTPQLQSLFDDYDGIVELCTSGPEIPHISLKTSTDILSSMRPAVNDLYSITASHYINAGQEGLEHFNVLMNSLISDLNLFQTPEINSVYACILYKGHKKDKTSDRSYRTISTCPLLAKGLDTYLRQLNIEKWKHQEADTQFQGEGSSHELAALLLTETIQHSLHTLGQPLYVLYLDARSAFDRVVIELLVRNLYQSGTRGHQLLFIKERLKNRLTFCEWDKTLMAQSEISVELNKAG